MYGYKTCATSSVVVKNTKINTNVGEDAEKLPKENTAQ